LSDKKKFRNTHELFTLFIDWYSVYNNAAVPCDYAPSPESWRIHAVQSDMHHLPAGMAKEQDTGSDSIW